MLVRLGNLLFRTRNALLPISFVALVLIFPPRPLGDPIGTTLLVLGVAMLVAGQAVRIVTIGLDYIRRGGKNKRIYADDLVTTGIYAHCRNPMYLGNVLIALGYLAVYGNLVMAGIGGALYVVSYIAIMRAEETYLAGRFGKPYEDYRRAVPRWIPRLGGIGGTLSGYDFDWEKVIRKEYGTLFTTAMVGIALVARKAAASGSVNWLPFGVAAGVVVLFYASARFWKKRVRKGRLRRKAAEAVAEQKDPVGARRERINELDRQLLETLSARAEIVLEVYAEKDRRGVPRYDAARTREILVRAVEENPGPLTDAQVERLVGLILDWYLRELAPVDDTAPLGAPEALAHVAEPGRRT